MRQPHKIQLIAIAILAIFMLLAGSYAAHAQSRPISALPSGGTLTTSDYIPVVRGGSNYKASVAGMGTQSPSAVAITGGTINLNDGTATAPALGFTTEPTVGMYRAAAGVGALASGTTTPLRWASSTVQISGLLTVSGNNLNFDQTGSFITGDFTNATLANRVQFQTTTANSPTYIGAVPSGTGTVAGFTAYNNSSPTNAGYLSLLAGSAGLTLDAGRTGTGTYLPFNINVNGASRFLIDTAGNGFLNSNVVNGFRSWNVNNTDTGTSAGAIMQAVTADVPGTGASTGYFSKYKTGAMVIGNSETNAAGYMGFLVGASERARIDSNGNFMTNTTTSAVYYAPGATFPSNVIRAVGTGVDSVTLAAGTNGNIVHLAAVNSASNLFSFARLGVYTVTTTAGSEAGGLDFYTTTAGAAAQRMRITDTGNVIIAPSLGSAGAGMLQVFSPTGVNGSAWRVSTNGNNAAVFNNAAGTQVGSITINTAATAYNTTSDARLKENVRPITDGAAVIDAINPVRYDWKFIAGHPAGAGMLAQELAAVVPDAVTRGDGAATAPGDAGFKQWQVDYSKLVPYLIADAKQQHAEIAALKAELAALKKQRAVQFSPR